MSALPRIGIVIPYYQREPGILRRTLESVVAQSYPAEQVVILDDGSPHPAQLELPSAKPRFLTLVSRQHQGISAARNAALDNVAREIDSIAFLDSDEVWSPNHLELAAEALSSGADFFFSNYRRENEAEDYFDQEGRRHLRGTGRLVYWTQGVPALMRATCPFMTSTVVYRRSIWPELQFSCKYRRAGEDHLAFWQLVLRAKQIMYSSEVTVFAPEAGIGAWRNATYGTAEQLERITDEIRLKRYSLRHFPLQTEDRAQIRKGIALRREVALSAAVHLVRRRYNVFGEIARLMLIDPGCVFAWGRAFPALYRQWRSAGANGSSNTPQTEGKPKDPSKRRPGSVCAAPDAAQQPTLAFFWMIQPVFRTFRGGKPRSKTAPRRTALSEA